MTPETRIKHAQRCASGKARLQIVADTMPDDAKTADLFLNTWNGLEIAHATLESPEADHSKMAATIDRLLETVAALEAPDKPAVVLIADTPEQAGTIATILADIAAAQTLLLGAYQRALESNPWADHVPVLKDLATLASKLGPLGLEISKLR